MIVAVHHFVLTWHDRERAFSKTMADAERSQLTTRLNEVYAEMEAAQIDKAPAKAALILYGLGFKVHCTRLRE